MTDTPFFDATSARATGAHAAPSRLPAPVAPEVHARTFGQFLHHVFTALGKFAADGGPAAERIVADPDFDAALELLLRAHAAGMVADMVAVMGDTLRHRLDAQPLPAPGSAPPPSYQPAPDAPQDM